MWRVLPPGHARGRVGKEPKRAGGCITLQRHAKLPERKVGEGRMGEVGYCAIERGLADSGPAASESESESEASSSSKRGGRGESVAPTFSSGYKKEGTSILWF